MTDEYYEQTPEELEAYYAPGGAPDTCFQFLDAIFVRGSYDLAWSMMDENQRLCRAQAWLWNNRSFPDIAPHLDGLAAWLLDGPHPGEEIWTSFSAIELQGIVDAWGDKYARGLGAASRPRPIGVDLELVVLAPTDGESFQVSGPTLLSDALVWTVRHTCDGCRIAAWHDRLPVPGWPPDLYPDVQR